MSKSVFGRRNRFLVCALIDKPRDVGKYGAQLAPQVAENTPAQLAGVFLCGRTEMATNKPRHGYERKRSQVQTKTMGQKHWTKRSRATGQGGSQ
jgi:hypothetical protein